MIVGNNIGINNGYQNTTSKFCVYSNVREYSKYLMDKYSCLTPGNNVAVTVTSGMLKKAMTDEKTGKWLERELGKAPDYIKQAQQAASARGSKLLSCTIEFGEEYTTMCVCAVTDTPGTDEDINENEDAKIHNVEVVTETVNVSSQDTIIYPHVDIRL